ncbi:WH1-domain-containing protein [Tothia fuscella]|uniref:WH1-domain-containing protein n=1 Tax=Tothia fuscella TaxID=1048955 RepID=A0A9P4NQR4_9PEZI|nr:WH1-domain-containing protein [Tothia fuscella]
MPSILSEEDKQVVKRTVPKPSNKIHAVAVAKLYIAYPDRSRWTYTGLQGAIVLANDLVGHTVWLKMVDVSPANRGVIWDQEIYDTFQYNQDRVFFHTFELEECMAGLSFADEKEAKTFKKKVDDREKSAHKNTKSKAFGSAGGTNGHAAPQEKQHHGFLGSLFGRHNTSHDSVPQARQAAPMLSPGNNATRDNLIASIDPELRKELRSMGIGDDQLEENADFIKAFLKTQQKDVEKPASRAPPPPPPTAPTLSNRSSDISPQHTGSTTSSTSRRGAPPAPPPPRRGGAASTPVIPTIQRMSTPSPPPAPPAPPVRFRVPPPIADAGRLVGSVAPGLPNRSRAGSNSLANPGPPPPPRPPKTPIEEDAPPKHAVPPAFTHQAPPPPARSPVPPPPPARETPAPISALPPRQLPPVAPVIPHPPARDTAVPFSAPPSATPLPPTNNAPVPPPLPPTNNAPLPPLLPSTAPIPPPLPPTSNAPTSAPPAPPPLPPPNNAPLPPPLPPSAPTAPPLPPPNSNAPPAPPPPPPGAALPAVPAERGGLLADIRGGARLKKVSDSEKKDASAPAIPGAAPSPGGGGAVPSSGGGDTGLAGALASALAARKSKVAHSDDEDDKDDW